MIIGPNDSYPWPQNSVNPRLHYSCEGHKDKILEAWSEAGDLTKAPWKWTRWNKYQKAMDDYIGPKSGQFPIFNDHVWCQYSHLDNFFIKRPTQSDPMLTASISYRQLPAALSGSLWWQELPAWYIQLLLLR